ncbi:PTS sugar transporter subunit IIA [Anoxybacteroides amylolyticum]|uniref:PTS system, glucose subfamily, IIA component domain protein n=1 Tax=Anoxybacteroides amylolyticum TaxID=294699 RepID=A0A167T2R6_9BACL|nr:PTS glucose transporter subunit IIA [Anoxybacillus amylolyticus]ANB59361.1 PTS system, glucose subfamily, IIA component domain protein [Anoxybacillus amylolyticus]
MIVWQGEETIFAPLNGNVIPIEEVPSPTFSYKLLGDGVAIVPCEGKVVSPVDGRVINIFQSKHAIGLLSSKGLEILIHIGLETVLLNGEGFTVHVKKGENVKKGDLLLSFDLSLIKKKAASIITPVIITNSEMTENMVPMAYERCVAGQSALLQVTMRKSYLFRIK